jgi:hypothetical protein
LAFGEKIVSGCGSADVVAVVTCDCSTGNLELGAGRFVHGNLVALGRGMIPLEIAGFVIGVDV